MGIRADLAAYLQGRITAPTVVYHFPVEVPVIPAAIVVPGDEYIMPLTFGKGGSASSVVYQFTIRLLAHRTTPETGLDNLESLRLEITNAIGGFTGARWISFGEIGETTIGDVPTLAGTVEIAIRTGDQV